ncbi:MAG: hypothetical protein QW416_02205 [Candidatus Nitrosocaldaceae archaeon]
MNDLPNDFCEKILALDDSIRFAAIMDRSEQIIMQATRKNIQLLLPKDVREFSLKTAAERMRARILLRPYIGKPLYSITVYQKITRVTIPLEGKYYILAVSMDNNAKYESILKYKLLPFLQKYNIIESTLV